MREIFPLFEVIPIGQFSSHSIIIERFERYPISMTSKSRKISLTSKVSYIFDTPVIYILGVTNENQLSTSSIQPDLVIRDFGDLFEK